MELALIILAAAMVLGAALLAVVVVQVKDGQPRFVAAVDPGAGESK